MTASPEMRDLAHCLLTYEAIASKASEPVEYATLRVYEKLRQSLSVFAGVAAFQSLALRALTQAKSEAPGLWAVKVEADGTLQGLGENRPQPVEFQPQIGADMDQASEEGVIFIARLLGLLLVFLGEAITMRLVQSVWPDAAFDDRNSEVRRKA